MCVVQVDTPILEATETPTVAGIPTSRLYRAGFVATARLQLFFTGETHQLFAEFTDEMRSQVMSYADSEGKLNSLDGFRLQGRLTGIWGDTLMKWTKLFQKAREVSATLPFGVLAEFHGRLVTPLPSPQIEERNLGGNLAEARAPQGVFDPQIQALLEIAAEFLYDDGLNISGRIWRMDRDARDGMNQVISLAVSEGKSAWQLAGELEEFLGADADCPRWTSTRLYKRSKKDIAAGDMTGLITNPNCDGQGVAYNALRLARTEIQKAHALATDRVMANSPWVEKEKINLSAQHPKRDICDDVVEAGEDGEGVYEKGEIELPLHPNCLCYKTAVLMPDEEFTSKLNAWMKGEDTSPDQFTWEQDEDSDSAPEQDFLAEMEAYAQFLGVEANEVAIMDLSNTNPLIMLVQWLFGEVLKL